MAGDTAGGEVGFSVSMFASKLKIKKEKKNGELAGALFKEIKEQTNL